MFPGYASRIETEMRKLYIEGQLMSEKKKRIRIPINIIDSPKRKYLSFIGASIISNVRKEFDNYWISKKDWEEYGANIFLKKCPNTFP